MTDDSDGSTADATPADSTPAGTECALCETDLSPRDYPDCRAVLIDESGPDGDEETIRMVCADCWSGLDDELGDPSGSPSTRSA
ncbi:MULTISPECIES: hypothetical protein [Halococcus]|uniref:Uncharacterized protein n=1 Tax=Halococcus salifodinae DSM 8989 TaxID=1227456 RepID=M0ND21_9EURY|nr:MULTISPECIES: hypothetical protein [Halococcus]EMA55458.1 hypothetical protein C450_01789 [Halococcus salifodinae DSM 8989]